MLVIPNKTGNMHKDSIKPKYPISDENFIKMLNMYEDSIKPKYPMLDENLSKGTKRFNMNTTMVSRNGVYACNSLSSDKFKSNALNVDLNSVRNIVSAVDKALSSMD